MKASKRFIVALALGGLFGIVLPPVPALAGTFRMYNWMQPPVDTPPSSACLTQRWHSDYEGNGRALDWKRGCSTASDTVYFRSRAAAPDDISFDWVAARGEPSQQPALSCGTGTVRYAWVKIRATWDGVLKGVAVYQHMDVSSTAPFDIWFRGAGSFSNAYFNSIAIGSTKSDAGAGSSCWTGYHVHENNRNTALWDLWNTARYNTGSLNCECHRVDNKDTWTRRLHWDEISS